MESHTSDASELVQAYSLRPLLLGHEVLLIEHGFGEVKIASHGADGKWLSPIMVKEALPHADFLSIF